MKRAVILHGTDGHPSHHWLPWMKRELEAAGYEIWVPELPGNHTPNRQVYDDFLRTADWDFTDNLVIGHSSGATTLLNLLSSDWFPHIKTAVLVGTFLNEKLTKDADWTEPGQFDNLFPPNGFDPELVKERADRFYFVHGDDDDICDPEDARKLCDEIGGVFVSVPGGGHLSNSTRSVPEMTDALRKHGDL